MAAIHALDWRQIRTWKGSQDAAFEELCCQLARAETKGLPVGAHFERRGAPDAGVECLWRLPTSTEWAWQAKFITESPRAKHWRELDESVKTALERNPQLRRYTICIPASLPDDRRAGRKSARQNWKEHVAKWTKWFAAEEGNIEFVLWDETILLEFLTRPEHAGRRAFWFGAPAFTAGWFDTHGVRPAVRQAATRYSPPLHIDVPVQQTFQGLIRSDEFHTRLHAQIERIRGVMEETLGFAINLERNDPQSSLKKCAEQFVETVSQLPGTANDLFDLGSLLAAVANLQEAVDEERRVSQSRSTANDDRSFIIAQLYRPAASTLQFKRVLIVPRTSGKFDR